MSMYMKEILAGASVISPGLDDDIFDRLHYFFTVNLLCGLAVLVSWKQFGGAPIECLPPDHFSGSWIQYVDNYCWAQGTYFVSDARREPPSPTELTRAGKGRIGYYQWVPFFLMFEAICFCVPRLMWNFFCRGSGIRISDIVEMSREKTNFKPEVRANTIKILSSHFQNALKFHRRIERRGIRIYKWLRPFNIKYTACYITFVMIMTKFLYFMNALMQFKLMNLFLFENTSGIQHIKNMMGHRPWNSTGFFPRVSYCVVTTRSMASAVQNHTIQCVLMINLFNEKIFFFLWFWYLFLMIFTAASALYWGTVLLVPMFAKRYITRHLKLADQPFSVRENSKHVHRFVTKYLQQDGVLALRMVSLHTGVIFATELVLTLWNDYFGYESVEYEKPDDLEDGNSKKPNCIQLKPKLNSKDNLDTGLLNIGALDGRINAVAKASAPPPPKPAYLLPMPQSSSDSDKDECEDGGNDCKREDKKKFQKEEHGWTTKRRFR